MLSNEPCWRLSPVHFWQICWAQGMLQYSGQSHQNLVKEMIWRLPGLLRSTCVLCQGKTGDKSFHTRRILTFTAGFQNGTHQGLNSQKSKGLSNIQPLPPLSLQAAKQGLLSVTRAADNSKTSSLAHHEAKLYLSSNVLHHLSSSPNTLLHYSHRPDLSGLQLTNQETPLNLPWL